MDEETYDQFALPHADVADELPYMQPNTFVNVGDRLKVDPREGRYISRA